MHHRRDFLRENKLNLRELQKNTTDKIIQQKQEIERKQLKHLHRYHKSQEHITVTRRSDSQRRYEDNQDRRHNHQPPSRMTTDRGTGAGGLHANPAHFRRSYSQQRGDGSRENILPTQPVKKFDSHELNKNQIDHKNVGAVPVPRCASATSIQSCDKEIQTEDIIDEDFLYEALKK